MKTDPFIRIQKKYGGVWVATDKAETKVFAYGKSFDEMYAMFEKKKVDPKKTAIGYMQKYGQTYIPTAWQA